MLRLIFLASLGLLVASSAIVDPNLDAQMNDALFKLSLQALSKQETEILSPFSVAMAMATVNEGAKGRTSQEITDVAFSGISKDQVTAWFKAKLAELKKEDSPMSIASALYIQKSLAVFETYKKSVKDNYQGKVKSSDFSRNPEGERIRINKFVNGTTHGLIPELLAPGQVERSTLLAVVNALYLKTAFAKPFPKYGTRSRSFANEDNSEKKVPTMSGSHNGQFFENDEFVYASIYFNDEGFSFFVIVPKAHPLAGLMQMFISDSHKLSNIQSREQFIPELTLSIPKFNASSDFDFVKIFKKLGMSKPFGYADFSGISPSAMEIEVIVHKAKLNLDEDGVTAAAATAILAGYKSAYRGESRTVHADRPFLYGVSHKHTPIFVGHYY